MNELPWRWGGFAGGQDAHAAAWRAGGLAITEALRGYLLERLDEQADAQDTPQDVAENLRTWATKDANPWGLVEWLDATGWKLDGLEVGAENAFAAAVLGCRRRAFLDRLRAAAPRNARTAALLEDPPQLDKVLTRLAGPDRPLECAPVTFKHGIGLAMFMAYPGLTSQAAKDNPPPVPAPRPRVFFRGPLPEPLPDSWKVHVALALDVLRGLLSLSEWGVLAGFHSTAEGERWLRVLARAWADHRLNQALEAHHAKPMRPRTVRVGGAEYALLSKVMGGLSWAYGGQAATVELDGHLYAPAPGMETPGRLAMLPPGHVLLPDAYKDKPHQAVLPIDTGEEAPPLALALAGAVHYGALGEAAGKLGVYILAASAGRGLQRVTLRELTAAINPGARLDGRYYQTVADALVELHNLRLFMPNGLAHNVFYLSWTVWKELSPEAYNVPLVASMNPVLAAQLLGKGDPADPLKAYRGTFLVNLTGTMGLPTKQAGLLRQYLRACATWNAYWDPSKGPDRSRIPAIPMERWAALTNSLPLAAVAYVAAGRSQKRGRNRMSEAIARVLDGVEDLEGRQLVVVDKANRKEIRLLFTDEWLEAWHLMKRDGKARKTETPGT